MKRRSRDEERQQRITMEIVVDAYTPQEQAMGWYYSLGGPAPLPVCGQVHHPARYLAAARRRRGRGRRDGPRSGVPRRDVRPDPLGTPTPGGSLGPAGGRRGGRADPPGDRGLAVLGRSGLRAVSNADLEGGTPVVWPPAARLPLVTGERLTERKESTYYGGGQGM